MSHLRTLHAKLFGADVELDQRVRLVYPGNAYEPADYDIEDLQIRISNENGTVTARPEKYPDLARAVRIGGTQL